MAKRTDNGTERLHRELEQAREELAKAKAEREEALASAKKLSQLLTDAQDAANAALAEVKKECDELKHQLADTQDAVRTAENRASAAETAKNEAERRANSAEFKLGRARETFDIGESEPFLDAIQRIKKAGDDLAARIEPMETANKRLRDENKDLRVSKAELETKLRGIGLVGNRMADLFDFVTKAEFEELKEEVAALKAKNGGQPADEKTVADAKEEATQPAPVLSGNDSQHPGDSEHSPNVGRAG